MKSLFKYANWMIHLVASVVIIVEGLGVSYTLGYYVVYWKYIFNGVIILAIPGLIYVIMSSKENESGTDDENKKHKYSIQKRTTSAAFIMVLLVSAAVYNYSMVRMDRKSIIVGSFNGHKSSKYKLSKTISSHLQNSRISDYYDIMRMADTSPVSTKKEASKIGEYYDADIVLWGWYSKADSSMISINFKLTDEFKELENGKEFGVHFGGLLSGAPAIGPSSPLTNFKFHKSFSSYVESLSSFMYCLHLSRKRNYEKALELARYSEKALPPHYDVLKSNIQHIKSQILIYGLDSSRKALKANTHALRNRNFSMTGGTFFADIEGKMSEYSDFALSFTEEVDDTSSVLEKYNTTSQSPSNDLKPPKNYGMYPWIAQALLTRGRALIDLEKTRRARKILIMSIAFNTTPEALRAYALLLARNDQGGNGFKYALEHIKRAIKLEEYHYQSYVDMSKVFIMYGKYEKAMRYADKAISIHDSPKSAYYRKGVALLKYAQKNVNKIDRENRVRRAINNFYHAISIDMSFVEAHEKVLKAYDLLGRKRKIIAGDRRQ